MAHSTELPEDEGGWYMYHMYVHRALLVLLCIYIRMLSMSLSARGVENITLEKLTTYKIEPHYITNI